MNELKGTKDTFPGIGIYVNDEVNAAMQEIRRFVPFGVANWDGKPAMVVNAIDVARYRDMLKREHAELVESLNKQWALQVRQAEKERNKSVVALYNALKQVKRLKKKITKLRGALRLEGEA